MNLTIPLTIPVIGTEYRLYLGQKNFEEIKIKATYLGHTPAVANHWFNIDKPEGHIFGRINNGLEIYCVRTNEKVLKETWLCEDAMDGPEWPVGFSAERFNGKLINNQKSKKRRSA